MVTIRPHFQQKPLLIACAVALSSLGCVSQGKYDAKVAELKQTEQALDEERRARAASSKEQSNLAERLEQAQAALRRAEQQSEQRMTEAEQRGRQAAELSQALAERQVTVTALEQQLAEQRHLLAEFEALAKAYGASSPQDLERALANLQRRVKDTEDALQRAAHELEREKRISLKLQALIDAGTLRVRRRSGRLVIELPGDIHFASGSAKLTPTGQDTLKQLATVLQAEGDRLFVVEGHTDNVPIQVSGFRSNWHLGATRAEVSRDVMIAGGLDAKRVAIASWAELLPACLEVDDPSCRQRNRRVEVVLLPLFE